MCLTLREKYTEPYNRKKFRWKMVRVEFDDKGKPSYSGPYTYIDYVNPHKWRTAERYYGKPDVPHDIGFHVFVTKKDAIEHASHFKTRRVVKVQVSGFNASGTFNNKKSETWKKMRIVKPT